MEVVIGPYIMEETASCSSGYNSDTEPQEAEHQESEITQEDDDVDADPQQVDLDIFTYDQWQLSLCQNDRQQQVQRSHHYLREPVHFPPTFHQLLPRTSYERQRSEVGVIDRDKKGPNTLLSLKSQVPKPGDPAGRRRSSLLSESRHTGGIRRESKAKQHIYQMLAGAVAAPLTSLSDEEEEEEEDREESLAEHTSLSSPPTLPQL
ncbi:uncharacterized protein LOC101861168 [Aplysia californica]|uniref:Uncharacterized protein LOC101861168 n=1 Tax=Aplysia californica TaxID=6500 RepID=A0ABM1ACK2_APLCA|nr:uncharacterized protein LOC101861168 [Aplysia californica]